MKRLLSVVLPQPSTEDYSNSLWFADIKECLGTDQNRFLNTVLFNWWSVTHNRHSIYGSLGMLKQALVGTSTLVCEYSGGRFRPNDGPAQRKIWYWAGMHWTTVLAAKPWRVVGKLHSRIIICSWTSAQACAYFVKRVSEFRTTRLNWAVAREDKNELDKDANPSAEECWIEHRELNRVPVVARDSSTEITRINTWTTCIANLQPNPGGIASKAHGHTVRSRAVAVRRMSPTTSLHLHLLWNTGHISNEHPFSLWPLFRTDTSTRTLLVTGKQEVRARVWSGDDSGFVEHTF